MKSKYVVYSTQIALKLRNMKLFTNMNKNVNSIVLNALTMRNVDLFSRYKIEMIIYHNVSLMNILAIYANRIKCVLIMKLNLSFMSFMNVKTIK